MPPGASPGHIPSPVRRAVQWLKGLQVLIQAAALLRRRRPDINAKLTILGALSGAEDFNLTSLVRTAGLDDVVTHLPPASATELACWYRSADVVVVPSYSESFGLVALEAQACGTPVVATRVGGLSRAVEDGVTGLLVDGRAAADCAVALETLYADPARRKGMGHTASVQAQSSGWQRTAAITLESYRTAAEQHSARGELLAL